MYGTTCTETGYRDEVTCECIYVEATDTMNREDCPVHTDVDGEAFTGGVCCRKWAETGRHARDCGNALLATEEESDIEWARRAA
jgi:hypothetical protein